MGPGHEEVEEGDEEDFGDFAGAQEEAQPQPQQPAQQQQQPAPSFPFQSSEQESDGDGEDFGDFSSAPTAMDVAATAATTGAPGGADVAAVNNGNGMGAGKGGGLDDLINSNLQPTVVARPVHLADLVSLLACAIYS